MWFIHIEAIDLVLAVVFRHYLMLILNSNHIEHHIQAMFSRSDMSTPELLAPTGAEMIASSTLTTYFITYFLLSQEKGREVVVLNENWEI